VKGATTAASANREVAAAIDRLVVFAGWADKYAQVLGCQNPVDGPFYNYTAPEPTGVVAMVPPEAPALLALVSLLAPPLCAGNTTVVIADVGAGPAARAPNPLPAAIFGEVCATSDVPAGVINILTATHSEVLPHLASHRDVDAISGANLSKDATAMLELGAAENVKRVRIERIAPESAWYESERLESPWAIEPFVEMKTIWHPASAM
jgi:acyl-CoA reductase-like NAD-dependent aldehyde dehydrogenase